MIEYDIWTWPPDLSVTPTEGRPINPDVIAMAPAPEFVQWPETRVEKLRKFGFAFQIARDANQAKAFWNSQGGRAGVFLMPTWTRDFTVGSQPASGATSLVVQVGGYGATYLTSTRRDDPGRYIYCYDLVAGLHVAKVLSSADNVSTSTLTIEQAFPFTPTREALYGFAELVRFDLDETEWISYSPTQVKAELVFRTVRESLYTPEDGSREGQHLYQSQGFTSFVTTVESTPLEFRVAITPGPVNLAVAQNATYDVPWTCWPSTTGGFRLLKDATPGVTYPDESRGTKSLLTSIVTNTTHVSLAFDQLSREVIAWQDGTNVKVARWQGGIATIVSWEGWTPILFWNGQINVQARLDSDTDVVCYYVKRGSGAVYARFQRDNFADEEVIGGWPAAPLNLIGTAVDGLVHTLTAMDCGFRKCVLSTTYPEQPEPPPDPYVALLLPAEGAGVEGIVTDTQDEYAIRDPGLQSDSVAASGSVSDITSEDLAPPPTDFHEGGTMSGSVADIAYEQVVRNIEPPQENVGSSGAISDMRHESIVVQTSVLQESVGPSASVQDIYYGP